jgi:hypothetical protein
MKKLLIIGTAALVLSSSAFASAQLRGKILGVFVRGPYDGTIDQAGLNDTSARRTSGALGRTTAT